MLSEIRALYEQLRATPFPELGKQVGDFGFYDSLLAGCADRAARGESIPAADIPTPDDETLRRVAELRLKHALDAAEADFLRYFELQERLRVILNAH
jgi:hypothetical protein